MCKNLDQARQLWRAESNVPPLDGKLLAALFGLTPAEQRVAVLLAQGDGAEGRFPVVRAGDDAAEIAAVLPVQANTVRSHIKQLLPKSNTRRQAEFVARVWRTAARLAQSGTSTHPASEGEGTQSAPDLAQLGNDSRGTAPETRPDNLACLAGPTPQPGERSK